MRNYEKIYKLLADLKTLADDDRIFEQSEYDRLHSPRIFEKVRSIFNDEDISTQYEHVSRLLSSIKLVQFFDYRGKRFFLDLPHLRIFSYVHDCLGKYAPNESLGDFAVHMAKIAREHVRYTNEKVLFAINQLARQ